MTASSPSAARAAVDQLEGLLAEATPGPWKVGSRGEVHADDAGFDLHRFDLMETWVATARERDADAALIVAAVNCLPHLLAAIKAVDELADRWAQPISHADWCCMKGCVQPNGQHGKPGALDNLAFGVIPIPLPQVPCPGTCTCEVELFAAPLRAALALAAVDVTETAK